MECRQCGSALERPGDFCLVCRSANADAVVLDLARDRATVSVLFDGDVVGARTVTTTPEDPHGRAAVVERRNFAGLVADDVRRKRPDEVYVTGPHAVVAAVRAKLRYPFYRVEGADPVAAAIDRREEPPLPVVDAPLSEKLGGSHSTLVGGRAGQRALETVADHPHVKKVVPGPIDAGGSGSHSGIRVTATRADKHGNVRLLVRDGSTVQENRLVTTAPDRDAGERVREDLNEVLTDADA